MTKERIAIIGASSLEKLELQKNAEILHSNVIFIRASFRVIKI